MKKLNILIKKNIQNNYFNFSINICEFFFILNLNFFTYSMQIIIFY